MRPRPGQPPAAAAAQAHGGVPGSRSPARAPELPCVEERTYSTTSARASITGSAASSSSPPHSPGDRTSRHDSRPCTRQQRRWQRSQAAPGTEQRQPPRGGAGPRCSRVRLAQRLPLELAVPSPGAAPARRACQTLPARCAWSSMSRTRAPAGCTPRRRAARAAPRPRAAPAPGTGAPAPAPRWRAPRPRSWHRHLRRRSGHNALMAPGHLRQRSGRGCWPRSASQARGRCDAAGAHRPRADSGSVLGERRTAVLACSQLLCVPRQQQHGQGTAYEALSVLCLHVAQAAPLDPSCEAPEHAQQQSRAVWAGLRAQAGAVRRWKAGRDVSRKDRR